MSDWLNAHKAKFNKEEAEKKAKEKAECDASKSRHESARRSLEQFVKTALEDLMGRKTKDGKKLRLELDKERNCAIVYAGDEKFLELNFWYKENERYDNDGCSWGDGTYYLNRNVWYYRKHKARGGYDKGGERGDSLYDEDLAHYLITFLK